MTYGIFSFIILEFFSFMYKHSYYRIVCHIIHHSASDILCLPSVSKAARDHMWWLTKTFWIFVRMHCNVLTVIDLLEFASLSDCAPATNASVHVGNFACFAFKF